MSARTASSLRLAWSAVILALCAAPGAALEVDPIYRMQVLGGQYFFAGEKGNLSGNASALAAPALRFDDRWALLPAAQASYQGTKQVVDLVGAGTLFQEQMDYRGSARLVWSPEGSPWRLKPFFSYKYELHKETKDERWGSGLFDYQKWCLGAEAEYLWRDPFSWRFGVDYYETNFPNYSSLESRAALQFQGQSLAREMVGDKVLNNQNLALRLAVNGPATERLVLEASLGTTYRHFPQQRVVDSVGNLTGAAREDFYNVATLAARMPAELNRDLRVLGGLELGYSYNASNQNNYDAANTRYNPYYYNYGEWRVGPSLQLSAGPQGPGSRPMTLNLSASWRRRRYPYRTAQDAAGVYDGSVLRITGWTLDAALQYPMARNFSLTLDVQYGQAGSNQMFEQFYRYNYKVTDYLFGISYAY